MLSSIRNNRKALSIVLWLVIIAFVATIFVVWGVGEQTSSLGYVAKVNDKIISYDEFQNRYRMADDEIRRYGGAIQIDNLPKRVISSLVAEKIMLMEAEKLNIPATDKEVILYIRSIPSFQINGTFSLDQYEAVLRNNNINTKNFEQAIKDEIKVKKLNNIIYQSQAIATDKEIENEYNFRKSTIFLDYATIPLNTFENEVSLTPSDKELADYYNISKEIYRVPTEIKTKYITFDKNKFMETYDIPDEQAREYFETNKLLYDKKDSADVSLIFIPTKIYDNTSVSETKEKIEEAYKELESGKSFVEVANEYNDKTIIPVDDGHIGTVEKGSLEKEMEDIIFNTPEKTYSKPTKTSNGYIIVYIHEVQPAKQYTFEEKKDEIKATIKNTSGTDAFNNYTISQFKKIVDSGSISLFQSDNKEQFNINELDFISENSIFPVTAIAINPETKASLYNLEKGAISQRIVDGSMVYIFEIVDKKNSYIPEMNDIKQQLIIDYRVDKITENGIKNIESDLAGSGFEKTASKYNAQIENTSFIRDNISLTGILQGNNPLAEQIAKTKSGNFLPKPYLLDSNFYIFKIASITPPTKEDINQEKETIANFISSAKGNVAIDSFVAKALEKAQVKYNQEFLNSMNITLP